MRQVNTLTSWFELPLINCFSQWVLLYTDFCWRLNTLSWFITTNGQASARHWQGTQYLTSLRVNPISLSYPFPFPYPFVLPLALVPRNRVVSARGENIPLWNETPLGYGYVIIHRRHLAATSPEATSDHKLSRCRLQVCVCRLRGF